MKKMLLAALVVLCINYSVAQPTAGLMAYWPMNGNFTDAGPNGINGTNSGATATTNKSGAANSAMNFNNPTGTVVQFATHPVNANVNFNAAQDFSITFSMFLPATFLHTVGFYDNNLNYGGYGVWLWSVTGGLQLNLNFKNGNVGSTPGAIVTNTWYNICCQRASGTLRIYINGVLNASSTEGTQTPVYTYPARFGTMFFNGITPPEYNGLNGKIDEMRIYNRALTAAEILNLATLPVKLSSFTANKNNDAVQLQWQTEYEQNSSHFDVQRSTDGSNFSTIATVQAKGFAAVVSNYQYIDNNAKTIAAGKTVFYRLQQVDKDGRAVLSSTVLVKFKADTKTLLVLQNPVGNELMLQLNLAAKEKVNLLITSATGQMVQQKSEPLNQGENFTTLPVHNLAKGNYFITLVTATEKYSLPFVKQ